MGTDRQTAPLPLVTTATTPGKAEGPNLFELETKSSDEKSPGTKNETDATTKMSFNEQEELTKDHSEVCLHCVSKTEFVQFFIQI